MSEKSSISVSLEFLGSHALFGGLNDKELAVVASFLKEAHFRSGHEVIRQDDLGDRLYLITKGEVEILVHGPGGGASLPYEKIATMKTGDTFGEMELIDIQPRCATVRALTDLTAVTLTNHDLYHIKQEAPAAFTLIILNVAREISRRLRKMDATVADLLLKVEEAKDSSREG